MRTVRRGGVVAAWAVLAALVLPSCSCRDEQPVPTPSAQMTAARAWVCEACGHTFAAPDAKGVQPCPQCGKEAAIRAVIYKCGKCGKRFEAWRFLDVTDVESPKGPDGKPIGDGMHFKLKGGQWVGDEEMLGQIVCPHCGNTDRERMEFAPPPPADK